VAKQTLCRANCMVQDSHELDSDWSAPPMHGGKGTLRALFRGHTLMEMLTRIAEPTVDTAAESEYENFLNDIVNGDVTPVRDDPAFAGKGNRIGADGEGNADSVAATPNTFEVARCFSLCRPLLCSELGLM
jgi:hypothetical protein